MPIDFDCAVCKNRIRVPDGNEGKRTKCPKCHAIQPVPSEADELKLKDSLEEPAPPKSSPLDDVFQPMSPPNQNVSRNPYAEESSQAHDNPYAAPQTPGNTAAANSARMEAMSKLQTPILTCLGLLALGIVFNIISLITMVIQVNGQGAQGANTVVALATYAITFGFAVGLQGFGCFGLLQARDLKNYGLAWAGFIIAALPCSCCFVVSLPISIWGMMLLADNSIQRQFNG
ncbi:hypothetical protein AB1L30_22600 [Bremerella sp. JC817]|uniref:hypothetical protein n=1 Tax=Bremerella sp. JC817 TaxID=3231756 RepID=UPI00345935D1